MVNGYELKKVGYTPWKGAGIIIQILVFIIIFIIGMVFLFVVINAVTPGGSPFTDKYIVSPLSKIGLGPILKKIPSTLMKLPTDKGQAEIIEETKWQAVIDNNAKNKNLGVKISEFYSEKEIVRVEDMGNEEWYLRATAIGSFSTTESTTIEFSCLTPNNQLAKIENTEGEKLIVNAVPNKKENFAINCIYDKDDFEIDTNKGSDDQKIKFRILYDFTTESYTPIYIVEKNTINEIKNGLGEYNLDEKEINNIIFKEVDDDGSKLNKNTGEVKPQYGGGPLQIIPKVFDIQPLTEEGLLGAGAHYTLEIRFADSNLWQTGNLEEIEEFYVMTTDEIEIISEEFEEFSTEDSYIIYKSKDSFIDKINDKCKSKYETPLEKIIDLIDESCWRSGQIRASVVFEIKNPPEEVKKTFIRTKVKYKFNDEKQKTIYFLNTD